MHLPAEFELLTTADGSRTLTFRRADGYAEPMHHRGGAWAECTFVYGAALEETRRLIAGEPRVLSIGLGLGYNEILTIAELHRAGRGGIIQSHEVNPFLRKEFAAWAGGGANGALAPLYAEVAARAGIEIEVVRRWWDEGRLRARGAFPAGLGPDETFDLVYYDAYSRKMDSGMWDEDFLVDAFAGCVAPTGVFATYAATGSLKRALGRLGFVTDARRGFRQKRGSTLAIRRETQAASRSSSSEISGASGTSGA